MVQNDQNVSVGATATADGVPSRANRVSMSLAAATHLISQRYPERSGLTRRIHSLYGDCYRVNFHDRSNANIITDSYFLVVTPGNVETLN
jgi:hypothetical protein